MLGDERKEVLMLVDARLCDLHAERRDLCGLLSAFQEGKLGRRKPQTHW